MPGKIKKSFIEGEHYYLENGFVVFTENYHKNRGYCCGNECRHCPYDPSNFRGTVKLKEKDSEE
jgi:hypothetical protein